MPSEVRSAVLVRSSALIFIAICRKNVRCGRALGSRHTATVLQPVSRWPARGRPRCLVRLSPEASLDRLVGRGIHRDHRFFGIGVRAYLSLFAHNWLESSTGYSRFCKSLSKTALTCPRGV